MRILICGALLALAAAAPAPNVDCMASINEALSLTEKLPPSPGRDVILRDIAFARDSRHENDEQECREQIGETLALLHAHENGAATQPDHGTR